MTQSPTRGRPRDPQVQKRIMRAALEEYARSGWSGFSMYGVARAANVGKSSLYLRWRTKEQLLIDSLESQAAQLTTEVDTGSLRDDIVAVATELLLYFLDPVGWTSLRLSLDAKAAAPHLKEFDDRITRPIAATATAVFDRAIERGEISAEVPAQTATELLFGGVLMHVLSMPADDQPEARTHAAQRVELIVRLLLAGLGADSVDAK